MLRWAGGLFVLLLAVAGCGADASAPPPIEIDRSTCARCGMLISDLRFAAASNNSGDEARVFDDIGCLVRAAGSHRPDRLWFADYATGQWIATPSEPVFVRTDDVHTPMGGGIVAFGARDRAMSFAASHNGTIVESAAGLFGGVR